jgi:two-component system, cell cycle response regulator
VSTNGEPIRILLVSEGREALRLRDLLESQSSSEFRIRHIRGIGLAAHCLTCEDADVLLLAIGPDQERGRAIVQAATAGVPSVPTVILSESESESLAVESLQQGAQDFIAKDRLDRATLVRSLRYAIERHRLQRTLQSLSLIDDLTGLHNRRGFRALAEQQLRLIQRKGSASLIYVDLDNLKSINDNHGHSEGNRALIATAGILRDTFRQSDILARIGGDEFCVLMTDAGHDSDVQVRERLQQRVDFTNAPAASRFRLSFSVGIADVSSVHQSTLEELLKLADALMYEQKRSKRAFACPPASLKQSTTA